MVKAPAWLFWVFIVFELLQEVSGFPADFVSWKEKILDEEGFGWQWEASRSFFLQKGYDLYVSRGSDGLKPRVDTDPATK